MIIANISHEKGLHRSNISFLMIHLNIAIILHTMKTSFLNLISINFQFCVDFSETNILICTYVLCM